MTDIRVAAEQARVALKLCLGALMEMSPCAEPECKQTQLDWMEAAERRSRTALASLEAALAAQPEQQQGLVAASPAAAATQQSVTKEQALESLSEVGLWLSRDPHALRLRQFIEQASPAAAAAAGVPTGWKLVPREPTPLMVQVAREAESMMLSGPDIYRAMLLASPVAPVGAPTRLPPLPEPFEVLEAWGQNINVFTGKQMHAYALLSAQGCELATDATKQLREHSVHLAATPIDQDFRMRPASSEAAPEQSDSDSVHPAMSTSSVPTAAPLLSSRETDRSELPQTLCEKWHDWQLVERGPTWDRVSCKRCGHEEMHFDD